MYPYPPQPAYYQRQYGGCLKIFLYGISFLVPLAGLIIGIVFISRGDPASKGIGNACLILGIISFVLACCLGVVFGIAPVAIVPFLESY